MKIVTMCQGGQVRSVGLKFLLHYYFGRHDVLACGWESNTVETRTMLFEWADHIIILDRDFIDHVPEKFRDKTICYHVGPDRWMNCLHQDLLSSLAQLVEQHGKFTPAANPG